MPRDAWGAEWGRYRRHKATMRRTREKRRAQRVNVVYLLRRVDRRLAWFGEPQLVAKVGRSSRSAYQRVVDLRSRCYELVAYWTVAGEDLPRAELTALHAMKSVFGAPCDGKEAFYVDTVEHAHAVVAASLTSYLPPETRGGHHDQLVQVSAALRASEQDEMRAFNTSDRSPAAWLPRRTGNVGPSGTARVRSAADEIRVAKKVRGRCPCEECRKADVQKSLF
jgi:hypothetical protein